MAKTAFLSPPPLLLSVGRCRQKEMAFFFSFSSSAAGAAPASPLARVYRAKPALTGLAEGRKASAINALSSPSSSSSSTIDDFWQWLCDKRVVSPSSPLVKPGTVPEGLGLVAQRDIPRNEVVLQVPKNLWINPDAVAASDIGRVSSGLKPWVAVALFLLREKARPDSPWRSYLPILPQSTHSPIFWYLSPHSPGSHHQ